MSSRCFLRSIRSKDDAVPQRLLEALDRRGMATPDVLQALGRLHARHGRFAESRAIARTRRRVRRHGPAADGSRTGRVQERRSRGRAGLSCARTIARAEQRRRAFHVRHHLRRDESWRRGVRIAQEGRCARAREPTDQLHDGRSLHRIATSQQRPFRTSRNTWPCPQAILEGALHSVPRASTLASSIRRAQTCRAVASREETAAGAHYFLARIARQANDLENARREVDAALQVYPKYADAWAELGLIQIRKFQYTEAEQSLGKALAIDPNNYVANVNLATLVQPHEGSTARSPGGAVAGAAGKARGSGAGVSANHRGGALTT